MTRLAAAGVFGAAGALAGRRWRGNAASEVRALYRRGLAVAADPPRSHP